MSRIPAPDDPRLQAAMPYLDAAILRYNLDPALIYGQTFVESSFRPDAFLDDRNGGSYGLMQMSLPTARGLGYTGPAAGLYDPATNTDLGCHLMAQLLARFGDYQSALAGYNAGPNNLPAGQGYAAKVLDAAAQFSAQWAQLQGGQDDGSADDVIVNDDGTSSTGGGVLLDVLVMLAALAIGGLLLKRLR